MTKEEARELDRSRLGEETKKILVDADRRDDEATARDAESDRREQVADRKAFVDPSGNYPGHGERRAAALDRAYAKTDRESSAHDRALLTDGTTVEVRSAESDAASAKGASAFDAESLTSS
jgi:hypothetical protein